MDNSVFAITCEEGNDLATGFIISQGDGWTRVMTCNHAISPDKKVVMVDRREAWVLHRNEDLDLAILSISSIFGEPVKFSALESNDCARLLGISAEGDELRKEPIDVTGVTFVSTAKNKKKEFVDHFRFEHFRKIPKGYSGSPVYDNDSHLVFAMLCRGQATSDNKGKGYALCFKEIHDSLSSDISNGMEIKDVPTAAPNTSSLSVAQSDLEDVTAAGCRTEAFLKDALAESLQAFDGQPIVWIPPTIRTRDELQSKLENNEHDIRLQDILSSDNDISLIGRQQYGLTSLGHHLCLAALNERGQLWIFVDLKLIKPYDNAIETWLKKTLRTLARKTSDVDAFVFDHYDEADEQAMVVVANLQKRVPSGRAIRLCRMEFLITSDARVEGSTEKREHSTFHLWALKKNSVRKIVEHYNGKKYIGDSDAVVDTVVRELSALNVPRTPMNCLMLLKIYEKSFDDSPVNRTELLHGILFLIFNVKGLPDYKTQPNVKDAEFILGWFCEGMVRNGDYVFERTDFIRKTEEFCSDSQIDIDVGLIFDSLYANRIIENIGSRFQFRFTSWVSYFLSHRMHFDELFKGHMLSSVTNSMYPEIIEFYAGIDRKRLDAVVKLTDIIRHSRQEVESRIGLPKGFNPYNQLRWKPSISAMDDLYKGLSDDVQASKLPAEIKDRYADRSYDPARPYSQSIHTIFKEYYVLGLMRAIAAGSRVLRNSDFVDSTKRHLLMGEILLAWRELVDVLISIAPALIQDGNARVGGMNFVFVSRKGDKSFEESLLNCIVILPFNVVSWFCDDLFSSKMSPLLMKHLKEGSDRDDITTHMLYTFMIKRRPKGWEKAIEKYIGEIGHDTYFLMDVLENILLERDYGNISAKTESEICRLATTAIAMHKEGVKKPNKRALSKVNLRDKKT